jgi:UDP-N-acetylglucosamine diphosphorylase / glucose-1-phosphate thymidylyltransferase / UDP-N-acetylgalactosamine diphosphorylase / glucosamine-1-phosphate N-acetyltransferase / galactosamine-1-phosphate N-acetyltransferase
MNTKDLFNLSNLPNGELKTWLEGFDNPLDILKNLNSRFDDLKGQTIHGSVEEGAYIYGNVFIGEGSVIHSGVVIEGPVIIGKNVSVRPHSNLRKGVYLCDDCVIGHGADIKHTLALPGAKIQDGTFAGDSLLGFGARVGSGTILANRKFNQTNIKVKLGDEVTDSGLDFFGAILGDYVRLAANVITSPGTVIGAHTWTGSGVVLQGTYEEDQLITAKQELEIRPKSRTELKSGAGEYEHI